MSSTSTPIPAHLFAAALPALPLSSLHAKAAEIRNAIFHLRRSNAQLRPHADLGDRDCQTAIAENEDVLCRMEERVGLLKGEVEGRGYLWDGGGGVRFEEGRVGGAVGEVEGVNGNGEGRELVDGRAGAGAGEERGGRLGDEELARRLRERMEEDGDGVHL